MDASLPSLETIAFARLAYGPATVDLAAYRALPGTTPAARFERWLDQQLAPQSIDDSACDKLLKEAGIDMLEWPQEKLWRVLMVENPYLDDKDNDNEKEYALKYKGLDQLRNATLIRAVYSKRQLLEVMTDFWHNHFSVMALDVEEIYVTFPAYDTGVIRANALGNFRKLLEGVTRSVPMLQYLDNATNRDEGPNENFARELLELHTLGAQNYLGVRDPNSVPRDKAGIATGYVDNDVYEVARCFTGWTYDMNAEWWGMGNTGAFLYRADWHDRFNKVVLGRYIPSDQAELKDGSDVLDLLASHPGTALHIAGKLCRRLIGDNPPARVVNEAARVFLEKRNAPDQIRAVIRSIALSPEFATTFGDKIRRPFEAAVAMLRATNAKINDTGGFFWMYNFANQPLFGRRSPDGYPDKKEAWSNTLSMLYRWRLAITVTDGWFRENDAKKPGVVTELLAETPDDQRSPDAAVDYWSERVLGRTLPDAQRARLVSFMSGASDESYGEYLRRMVQLILMSPEFQLK